MSKEKFNQSIWEDRIDAAVEVISRYGMFDGAHHKQWVLDQAVRAMLGEEGYEQWVKEMNTDSEDYDGLDPDDPDYEPEYEPWDVGIPP